jgi:TM2 domain-containing membrane protein YozV
VQAPGPLLGPVEEGEPRYSPAAAAALSMFLPGVGQIYSGRVPQGIGWLLATGLGYLLFLVPGLILHICCVVNAAAVPTVGRMLPQPAR